MRPMIRAAAQAQRCRDLGPLGEGQTALTEQECTGGGFEVLIEAESFAATKSEKVLYAGSLVLEQAEIENPNSEINQHRQPT
jgi:hypothetical protein